MFYLIFLICLLTNAQSCEVFIHQQEQKFGIPSDLLRAVSLTESGRTTANKQKVAWPWTINVEGRGYMFSSKAEAIQAVEKFQRKGIKSIDVGCMQVNLKHHANAFKNLHEAFNPQTNVAYAAQFLKNLNVQNGTWDKAVAHYHSASPRFHNPYRQRVMGVWQKLKNNQGPRLQTAVFQKPQELKIDETPSNLVQFAKFDAPLPNTMQAQASMECAPPEDGKFISFSNMMPAGSEPKIHVTTTLISLGGAPTGGLIPLK